MTESRESGPEPIAAILPEVLADLEERQRQLRAGDAQQAAADALDARRRFREQRDTTAYWLRNQ